METKALIHILRQRTLNATEASACIALLTHEAVKTEEKAALLMLMEARCPTAVEMAAFSEYLLQHCTIPFQYDEPLMDVCGTGGDGYHTVNISTLTALVLAATGIKMAKHGNYGVTSVNGSSSILEYFGYTFKTGEAAKRELDEHNITFLHAPLFFPVLKNMAGLRKNLGTKTIFNLLGPMVNPLQPQYRYTGVSSLQAARAYHFIYQQKQLRYNIVYTIDGNDEITLTDRCKIFSHAGEYLFHPQELATADVSLRDLQVDRDMEQAADLFTAVLQHTAPQPVITAVLANAAKAYQLRKEEFSYEEAYAICAETLKSGKAARLFNQLIRSSNGNP